MDQQISETFVVQVAEPPALPEIPGAALAGLRREVAQGLLYTHDRANSNTGRILEAASFLYALIELLQERGILKVSELDARQPSVFKRLEQLYLSKGMGMTLQVPEQDKYAVSGAAEIDCATRVDLCGAACCRLWFPLSHQDVDEGVVQWDLALPYIIAQDAEGYCKHLHRGNCRCSVYQHRPLPCRAFDCRKDPRIWLDFENRVINPDLDAVFQGQPPRPG